jgi:hypothetical protein
VKDYIRKHAHSTGAVLRCNQEFTPTASPSAHPHPHPMVLRARRSGPRLCVPQTGAHLERIGGTLYDRRSELLCPGPLASPTWPSLSHLALSPT